MGISPVLFLRLTCLTHNTCKPTDGAGESRRGRPGRSRMAGLPAGASFTPPARVQRGQLGATYCLLCSLAQAVVTPPPSLPPVGGDGCGKKLRYVPQRGQGEGRPVVLRSRAPHARPLPNWLGHQRLHPQLCTSPPCGDCCVLVFVLSPRFVLFPQICGGA